MRAPFQFRQFAVEDSNSPMKVNTDAVLLGAWIQHFEPTEILEIGTGCGVISLMLAQRFKAMITAIDIDAGAIRDARINFNNSPWSNQFQAFERDFREFKSDKQFDLIVSNPPYFTNSLKSPKPEKTLSKHTDSLSHEALIAGVSKLLKPGGSFGVIIPDNSFEFFNKTAQRVGLFTNHICKVKPTGSKPPHRVLVKFAKAQTENLQIEELILHNAEHIPTTAYKKLTADFYPAF